MPKIASESQEMLGIKKVTSNKHGGGGGFYKIKKKKTPSPTQKRGGALTAEAVGQFGYFAIDPMAEGAPPRSQSAKPLKRLSSPKLRFPNKHHQNHSIKTRSKHDHTIKKSPKATRKQRSPTQTTNPKTNPERAEKPETSRHSI